MESFSAEKKNTYVNIETESGLKTMNKVHNYPLAMKLVFAAFVILIFSQFSSAQDTIPIQFHQETDTLVKQRFIDRYENVFMTKVPTKHMFKAAAVGSEVQGAGINLGYEYKLMPALSIEASVYSQLSWFNSSLAQEFIHLDTKRVDIWGSAKLRWYYNMNKRIRNGLNANNFSGGYLALAYEQPLRRDNLFGIKKNGGFSLLYGFQSRFFNHGFIDFALGIYQKEISKNFYSDYSSGILGINNFVLGTQARMGIALGDWKKSRTSPLCDVMICNELIQDQLKIELPNIAIGFKQQTFNPGLAYEIKLANSPFSIQANASLFYRKEGLTSADLKFLSTGAGLEFRYYYLQKLMIRRGKSGGNLSGLYTGIKGSYDITTVKRKDEALRYPVISKARDFNTALSLGYQQRLFRRIYIDGSVFYNKTSPTADKFTVFPFPLDYRTFGISRGFISSKMSIGFTF